MKKGKVVMTMTIGLICFILTYIIFMQFKTVEETNITQIENLREAELREKLASWQEKYEETNEKLIENQEKINEYRTKRESNQESTELLNSELTQARTMAGLTNVRGNGIVITLKDNPNIENGNIEASNLIELVNELRFAGAEAISINDQRIVNMSDIVDIAMEDGSKFVLVNKKRLVSPYIIKAIGDQKYLESELTKKTAGYIDRYSKNATLERQNNIKIMKYTADIQIKYSNIKEEK